MTRAALPLADLDFFSFCAHTHAVMMHERKNQDPDDVDSDIGRGAVADGPLTLPLIAR
jgi:hypothetical protein